MKYTGLSSQEIVGNWKLLKAISFEWMGQTWDCSGFILSTKQWKKSYWEWKGQGASRLEPKSEDDSTSEAGRVLSARPVFTRNSNCRIHARYCPKVWYLRSGQQKNDCLHSREGRQTNQTTPPPLYSFNPHRHTYVCTNKIFSSVSNMDQDSERVTADGFRLICWQELYYGKNQAS